MTDENSHEEPPRRGTDEVPTDAPLEAVVGGSEQLAAPERSGASVMPFENLAAPTPLPSDPPKEARWLAFLGVIVGGLLGGLIGFGTTDLLSTSDIWPAVGGLLGGVGGAIGVGIVASLTLRAMNEWKVVQHPEETGLIGATGRTEAVDGTSNGASPDGESSAVPDNKTPDPD